jgi:hypothetical protein
LPLDCFYGMVTAQKHGDFQKGHDEEKHLFILSACYPIRGHGGCILALSIIAGGIRGPLNVTICDCIDLTTFILGYLAMIEVPIVALST